jgi:hypothetical protein
MKEKPELSEKHRGLLGRLGDALFEPEEKEEEESDEKEKPPLKTKAAAMVESGTDPTIIEKTRTALLAKFKEADPNAGLFLKTYSPLAKHMQPAPAVAAALDVLKEDNINAAQVKIGIGEGRERLEQINKDAEERYQQAIKDLQTKRTETETAFKQQREDLEKHIADLNRQVVEAQQQLTALPGQESAEISKSAPDIQKAMVAHESFSAAYRSVLSDIQTVDSFIVIESENK